MEYLHDRDRSLACLRATVSLMGKHCEVLDPLSYAVWYDYAAGGSRELIAALDGAIARGGLVGQATVRAIYLRHVARPEDEASRKALEQVAGLAQALSQSTDLALRANQQLDQSLDDFENRLQGAQEPAVLGVAVSDMRQASAHTQDSIAQVSGLLAQHNAEVRRLQTELEQARQEAALDGLTQLLNRRAFDRALHACLPALQRGDKQPAALVLLDVDCFKQINDTYGHAFGDDVLRAIGHALRAVAQPGDAVSRFGGDEFALLLRRPAPQALHELTEGLRLRVAGSRIRGADVPEARGKVTISAGAALFRPGEDALKWLKRADAALYDAKGAGRNRVSWAR